MTKLFKTLNFCANINFAVEVLNKVKQSGESLLVLTGAGMSVQSGVPVFRNSDGSMSPDFQGFLSAFNSARRRAGLSEAEDWFDFSVPEMFRIETEREAWKYWRWRMLRANVSAAHDYNCLMRIIQHFGADKTFVITSNVDSLHISAGLRPDSLLEIHGSLQYVQCSVPCTDDLWDVDSLFLERLKAEEDWVPRCAECGYCLRPNVMIFEDDRLVESRLETQKDAFQRFMSSTLINDDRLKDVIAGEYNLAVLEVGAGKVVPSIRLAAEGKAKIGKCLIRVNPSEKECVELEYGEGLLPYLAGKYFPLIGTSEYVCHELAEKLT